VGRDVITSRLVWVPRFLSWVSAFQSSCTASAVLEEVPLLADVPVPTGLVDESSEC
jgi:hypothetical protein